MNHLAKLIKLDNKLLRILQQKPTRTHTALLYRTYHTLPVQLSHDYQILVFMHKYVHQLPPVFSAYFDENNLIHHYNTRKKMTFILMVFNLKLERGPLTLKAVNFGITCQQILKHNNHPPLLSTDSGIT